MCALAPTIDCACTRCLEGLYITGCVTVCALPAIIKPQPSLWEHSAIVVATTWEQHPPQLTAATTCHHAYWWNAYLREGKRRRPSEIQLKVMQVIFSRIGMMLQNSTFGSEQSRSFLLLSLPLASACGLQQRDGGNHVLLCTSRCCRSWCGDIRG